MEIAQYIFIYHVPLKIFSHRLPKTTEHIKTTPITIVITAAATSLTTMMT
jgi:hypothetical protein